MSTHTDRFLSFDFFSVRTPHWQITPSQTLQHTHHQLFFIHLPPSSGGTVTFILTDANCFNILLWNQTFPRIELDTQQMHSIFYWLLFTTLTIVHTVENHGGVCRGFGAQRWRSLIRCKIRICDIRAFYIFNWKTRGGKKTQTNQMEVTNKTANRRWGKWFGNKMENSSCRTSLMYRATWIWTVITKSQRCCFMEWLAVFQEEENIDWPVKPTLN